MTICKPQGIVRQGPTHSDAKFIDHFVSWISGCHFATGFTSDRYWMNLMLQRGQLQDVAIAIGALDASRRPAVSSRDGQRSLKIKAFVHYQKAVATLQHEVVQCNATGRDDVLWCSFLLGLFDVRWT